MAMVGRVLSVHQPYAWALVAGVTTTEERARTTSYRGRVFVHAGKETDLTAPAELWPTAGRLVAGAVLGWVTLDRIDGEPGRYLWRVTGPVMLPEPVTGVRGWPGLWFWHLPPELQ